MLTRQQHKALDVQRHLSVTANAGAGKTTVLVERYLEILTRTSTRVSEIVAITFTEKAAKQLRRKIAGRIDEVIHRASSARERQRFEHIRDELSSASIGTIHSFCAQLLRTFPVEAGVDAAFTVLEGVDQRMLQQEAVEETFEQIMRADGVPADRQVLLELVRMFGKSNVQQYLTAMVEKREQVETLLSGLFADHHDDRFILEQWRTRLHEKAEERISENEWKSALHTLIALANGPAAADLRTAMENLPRVTRLEEKVALLKEMMHTVFTREGEFRKKFIGTANPLQDAPAESALLSGFATDIVRLSHEVLDETTVGANAELLRVTRGCIRLYRECEAIYERRKSENGTLDFEDLQLKTRTLLGSPRVRERVSRKYKYVMVDEFQDTNRLQYDIVRGLVNHYTAGNLFIVGDPKQSIYGFRNAEVQVFAEARNDIVSSPRDEGTAVILAESFRPLTHLVTFTNMIFRDLMRQTSSSYDVPYDDLVQGRTAGTDGVVEMLLVPPPVGERVRERQEEDEEESADASECNMIARRLLELKRDHFPIHEGSNGKLSRHFEYKDAAILLRDRRRVRAMERALDRHRIPYALLGGIGFYQTQEVYDFLNYFKFLLNPGDDVALVGILRSPFHAVPDTVLYEISLTGREGTFWEKSRLYAAGTPASGRLTRALSILSRNLACANRLSIPQLVQRILIETGWRAAVSGLPSGAQHSANVNKLLRLAREFESKGYTTLYDFVERLKVFTAEQDREGQASLDALDNGVQVMTVHSAKGLEFPVVFLPFTHNRFRYDAPPFLDAEIGLGLKTRDPANLEKEQKSALYLFLEEESRRKTESEEKRILYVACTRASHGLMISGQLEQRASGPTYLTWLLHGLQEDPRLITEGRKHYTPQNIDSTTIGAPTDGNPRVATPMSVTYRFCKPQEDRPLVPEDQTPKEQPPQDIFVSSLPAQVAGEFFSATQIKTFLECPSKYLLKYVLGLPEKYASAYAFDENSEASDKLFGEKEGIVVHTLLEELRNVSLHDDEMRSKVHAASLSAGFDAEALGEDRVSAIARRIIEFKNSKFGTEVLSAAETMTEYSMSTIFDDDFLTGTVDRLYKDRHGQWCVVDYKTDTLQQEHLQSRGAVHLPQLIFYAYLVFKLFGQENIRCSIVFLQHPSLPLHYDIARSQLEHFENMLRSAIQKIKAGDFGRNQEMCDTCTYQTRNGCLIPSPLSRI